MTQAERDLLLWVADNTIQGLDDIGNVVTADQGRELVAIMAAEPVQATVGLLRANGYVVVPPGGAGAAWAVAAAAKRDEQAAGVKYGCHLELEGGQEPDGCLIDEGRRHACLLGSDHATREDCPHWRRVRP